MSSMAVGPLNDKRLQIWRIEAGELWSCSKTTTDSNSPWTAWTQGWIASGTPFQASALAVAPLSDGRLQLWATDDSGNLRSCWKTTTDSNSPWTPWTYDWIDGGTPFKVIDLAAAQLSDGRIQLWGAQTEGALQSTWNLTTVSTSGWNYWTLFFLMQQQQQTQWCWSAVATSTSLFFDYGSPWTQCSLANAELSQTTCCSDGGSSACNQPWFLDRALSETGNLASWAAGTEPLSTLQAQNWAGLPLGARIGWRGGGGHVVMLSGSGPNQVITVLDPWYGTSQIPYATFVNNYQGSGSWTHSYFTES
jgi:hypothetical protein